MSQSTFQKYAGQQAGNYCTLPTIDVPILPETHHCEKCSAAVEFNRSAAPFGSWVHVADTASAKDGEHSARPKTACPYCHAEDGVTFHMEAWSDEIRCTRCGGTSGRAIGD